MSETTVTQKNAYAKLMSVRYKFLQKAVQKTGKNRSVGYMFFELDDIVPAATPLFHEEDLIPIVSIDHETAVITLVNCDNPQDNVVFTMPAVIWNPAEQGNKAINPIQAMGATLTYYRRYLYMLALDIAEPDAIDGTESIQGGDKPAAKATATAKPAEAAKVPMGAPKAEKPAAPATPAERAETKKALTDTEGPADEMQIKGLKMALAKLKAEKPAQEEWVQKVVIATNSFKDLSKTKCEQLIAKATEKLETNQ